jgi:hypothetical protein
MTFENELHKKIKLLNIPDEVAKANLNNLEYLVYRILLEEQTSAK